jgi:hypothetical protein
MFTYTLRMPIRSRFSQGGLAYMIEHAITLDAAFATLGTLLDAWRARHPDDEILYPHRSHGIDYPRGHAVTVNGADTFACGDSLFEGIPTAVDARDCYEINAEYLG